jgi:divalent metal cation (Fe/Co/Zn/Cd) transporter
MVISPALHELMDGAPPGELMQRVTAAAMSVPGVIAIEPPRARKNGTRFLVDMHVQADPDLRLFDAHELGHRVQEIVCAKVPEVASVLVHMEPYGEHSCRESE